MNYMTIMKALRYKVQNIENVIYNDNKNRLILWTKIKTEKHWWWRNNINCEFRRYGWQSERMLLNSLCSWQKKYSICACSNKITKLRHEFICINSKKNQYVAIKNVIGLLTICKFTLLLWNKGASRILISSDFLEQKESLEKERVKILKRRKNNLGRRGTMLRYTEKQWVFLERDYNRPTKRA